MRGRVASGCRVAPTCVLVGGLLVAGGRLPAQTADTTTQSVALAPSAADSAELLAEARAAQHRFEYVRRRHLPTTFGWGSGECDDRVGRMCWTHETGSLWTPEPEAEEVTAAREELLDELEGIGEVLPGDEWVLGQRVWYLVEAERTGEALAAARICGGARWWCAALEGLVLHVEGRYPEAERAFGRALATMGPERAEQWEEVRPLVDRDARSVLDEAAERSPVERQALIDRLWRLSDPLHVVPGNERRTEHLARRTVSRIRSEARNPHNISWGDDLAELLVRYGWGVGWERVAPDPGQLPGSESVVGHEHPESRVFVPRGRILRNPLEEDAGRWAPRLEYAPSAYAPGYGPVVLPMTSRLVVLTRGERAVVAATWELPADTTLRGRKGVRPEHRRPAAFADEPVRAGFFLAPVDGDTVHAVLEEERLRGVQVLEVPAGGYWASVEVLDPGAGRAGRYRRGLEVPALPPDAARVSDLLLVETGPLPDATEDALRRLKIDDTVISGGSLVVGWEIWGLGWRNETLRYRLSLEGEEGGFFHRVGRTLGLVDPERPRSLEWEEPGPERPGAAFRSVAMDIPDVEPGLYRLRLEVRTPGRTPLITEQTIRVVTRR